MVEEKMIKAVVNKLFTIELKVDEDSRYCVKYKRNSMKEYVTYSFQDLKLANHVFDKELVLLEGH